MYCETMLTCVFPRISIPLSHSYSPFDQPHVSPFTLQIARKLAHKSFAKNLAGGVKEVLGTCQSVGCTVDGKPPHDIIEAIDEGEIVVPDE